MSVCQLTYIVENREKRERMERCSCASKNYGVNVINGIKRRGPHLTMWSSLTFKKLTIKHGYLILYPKTFLFSLGIWCKGNTCFLNLQENVLPESSCLLQNATNYCYITSVYVCGNIFVSIMCVFFFVKLNILYCRTQFFNVILLLFQ